MVKNPYGGFYFLLPFFFLALAFVILLTTLVHYYHPLPKTASPVSPVPPVTPVAETQMPLTGFQSRNLPIEFQYPVGFKITETNNGIRLTNNLKIVFNTQRPGQKTVDNFSLTLTRMAGTLDQIKDRFFLEEKTISRGDQILFTGYMGVEGTGENHYLVKLGDSDWLAVSHPVWYDPDVEFISREQSGYLNAATQDQLVDLILSSLKIIPPKLPGPIHTNFYDPNQTK